ncbi:uncharacterized protein LOC144167471 [Haemaphysalis longicornis]
MRMKFSEFVFSDAEESPMVSWNGALRALSRNALGRLVDRGFETFWRGSALDDEPWLDADERYLAIPAASADRLYAGDVFYVHHLPRVGLDLARAVVRHFMRMALHFKKRHPAAHLRLELLAECLRRQFYGDKAASHLAVHNDVVDLLALAATLNIARKRFPAFASKNSSTGGSRTEATVSDRRFFYEFARSRCESYDDAYLHLRTHHGTQSPAPFFVNGPLRSFPPFATAFGCARGSYMLPKHVCKF